MAVISGVGVKEYYRKRGFVDEGCFLVKKLKKVNKNRLFGIMIIISIITITIMILINQLINQFNKSN